MAIYQLGFWLAVVVICAGVGVGALYWFYVRDKAEDNALQWNNVPPEHRTGAQ